MTNKEFIEELSRRLDKTEKDTASLASSFTECLSQTLQEDKIVNLQGFGSFEVKKKMERISVNPVTKQRFLVPPKLALAFKPSAVLKEKFKNISSCSGHTILPIASTIISSATSMTTKIIIRRGRNIASHSSKKHPI